MAVYDQIKKAFQDIVAPEIRALQGDIKALQVEVKRLDDKIDTGLKRLDDKIDTGHKALNDKMDMGLKGLEDKIDSLRRELIAEFRRVDGRLDSLDRELKVAIEVRERIAILESKLASR